MSLTMRPTGLGSGIDKDRPDYGVHCGGWAIGRIHETRGGPEHLRWFWSLTVNCPTKRARIAWRPLTRPRQSFESVGTPGTPGLND